MYFIIKQNGIKSTVNFQLNFTKDKKQEESLPELSRNALEPKEEEPRLEDISTSLHKRQSQMPKAEPVQTSLSPCKVRNVSLPNLKIKKKPLKFNKEMRRAKKRKEAENPKIPKKAREEEWDEIFFHYFEEFLDRFI